MSGDYVNKFKEANKETIENITKLNKEIGKLMNSRGEDRFEKIEKLSKSVENLKKSLK